MIALHDVTHRYGERVVVRDVSLQIAERRVAVLGSNGSGKSTFARLLNGLVVPSEGKVVVDGFDTRRDGRAVRGRVGFVFQNPDVQIVYPTVEEDIAFGLKARRVDRAEVAQRVDAVLARYGLERYRDHPAHKLSGGEKQLLATASALVLEPEHVVFDEPTTLLDRRNRRKVIDVIRALPQHVVVATHDLEMIADFDRAIVLDEGRVVADDVPAAAIAEYVKRVS